MGDDSAYDPEQPHWSVMTKSRGGTVSVIRGLTLREAAQVYERTAPWYGETVTSLRVHKDYPKTDEAITFHRPSIRHCSDGDIDVREVFGPPGWGWFTSGEITSWPKCFTVWTDDKGAILPDEMQDHPDRAAFERRSREIWKMATASSPMVKRETPPAAMAAAVPDQSGDDPAITLLVCAAVVIAMGAGLALLTLGG